MKTWFSMRAATRGRPPEVLLYDEIGAWGVNATDFMEALRALGDLEGKDADLRINSPGGDCFTGNAIFNMCKATGAKWTVHIDGVAASMASLVATVGAKVNIAANAFIMIHNPAAWMGGEAADLRRTARLLDSIRDGMLEAYVAKSGMTTEEIGEMMDAETWMDAEDAVKFGFADTIVSETKAAAKVRGLSTFDLGEKFAHLPPDLAAKVKAITGSVKKPQPKESKMDADELKTAMTEANKPVLDALGTLATALTALAPKEPAKPAPETTTKTGASAADIVATCKLAGFPELSGDYIASGKSMDEVREDLGKKQAEAATAAAARGAPGHRSALTSGMRTVSGGEEDISDLVPKPTSDAEKWAKFHGSHNGRSH